MITHWKNAENGLPKEMKDVLCWVEEQGPGYATVLYLHGGKWRSADSGRLVEDPSIVKKWYAFTKPQKKKAC